MIDILLNFGTSTHFHFISNVSTSVPKFCKFLGDVETRRVVSRISSSHVTWQAGDITIPFIFPLMPTVTHTFPQSRYFPENRGRRFAKLFPRARTDTQHKHIRTRTLELFDSRVSRSSRVVNTNCRSVIGFFGKVVGSLQLPRRTTYPRVAALANIWHASTADTRKPSCMPPIHKPTLQTIVVGTTQIWV